MGIVEDLENSIDIVDLVGRYSKLKKAWANYKTICPFPGHNEKTPSFVVSPSKQLAYCFGCHRWGSAVKFIMDIENVSFKEAIDILGWITGIETGKATENFKDMRNVYTLMNDVLLYYKERIQKYPEVLKYLYDRWATKEDLEKFSVWFSDSGIELYKFLKDRKYEDDLIAQANVFMDFASKKDKFINRIIYPIQNIRWDVVWFAGRVIDPNQNPKYLNSPASEIYDKSQILYGLYQAKSEIVKKDYVIITEGYMDVIALHRAWIGNAVCVSGTALTEKHIPIIKRLTKKIYLCFDNDAAWEKATAASIELLKNREIEVKVIDMSEYWNDPDEIIQSWKNFEDLVKKAKTPIGYYLDIMISKYDLNSIEDKKKLLKELLDILRNYTDIIEKDFYLKEISRKLDIGIDVLYAEFNNTRTKRVSRPKDEQKRLTSEDIAIWMILFDPKLLEEFKKSIVFPEFLSPNFKAILDWSFNIEEIDIAEKNKYLGISIKIEERIAEMGSWYLDGEVLKLCKKIDLEWFSKIHEALKKKIVENPDDIELLQKYTNILKKASENGLK